MKQKRERKEEGKKVSKRRDIVNSCAQKGVGVEGLSARSNLGLLLLGCGPHGGSPKDSRV